MQKMIGVCLLVLAGICLAGGAYLLPAGMWRSISAGLLCIGAACAALGLWLLLRKK